MAKGTGPEGKKVDGMLSMLRKHYPRAGSWLDSTNRTSLIVTMSLSDEDFGKLVSGKANAQKLFMTGKLKIKGDVMKATKAEPVLKKAQTKAKL